MGILKWIFGSKEQSTSNETDVSEDTDKGEDDRPPKPESYTEEVSQPFDLYGIGLTYQNGESESIEAVKYSFDERVLTLLPPKFRRNFDFTDLTVCPQTNEKIEIPYETLSSRPVPNKIGTVEVDYKYEVEYKWRHPYWTMGDKYWRETFTDFEITDVRFNYSEE